MKRWKEQKGSITLFVLVAMLFFVMYIVGMYVLNASSQATQIAAVGRIKEIYEKDVNQIDDVYATMTKDNMYEEKDNLGNIIPIPIGFSPIKTAEQGNRDTGFVIKNDTDGNEFVWIPCSMQKETGLLQYSRYVFDRTNWDYGQVDAGKDLVTDSTKIYRKDFTTDYYIEALDSIEKASIEKYKGFYLARYEVGTLTKRTTTTTSVDKIEIGKSTTEKPIYPYNFVTFEEAKKQSEGLYTKENNQVITKLCSSYAWDTALKFIETKVANYGTSSTGNYSNMLVGTPSMTGKTLPTNNIYDMGGNVYEWTTETWTKADSYAPVLRGGCYTGTNIAIPAAVRANVADKATRDPGIGFRIAMYLQ